MFSVLFYPKIPDNYIMTGLSTQWVETKGGTSSLVTLGETVENSLRSLQDEHLILIIPGGWWVGCCPSELKSYVCPGNPGLAGMYEDFMTALKSSLGSDCDTSSIWTFSHLGHDTLHPPCLPTGGT